MLFFRYERFMEISGNLAIGQQEKRHTIKNTPCDPLEEFDDPKDLQELWATQWIENLQKMGK